MTDRHDTLDTRLEQPTRDPRRIAGRDVSLLAALELGAILLWAFWQLVGVDLEVTQGGAAREVTLVAIVLSVAVASVASYALFLALRRHGLRVWTTVAVAVLLLSCAGPLLATTPAAGVALLTFHLVVGGGLIVGVRHLHRAER